MKRKNRSSIILANKIRVHTLHMTSQGKSSHIASIFSIVDIISVLYENILEVSPKKIYSKKRDRFILSKGHAGAAIYAVLAEKGFISMNELIKHCKNGSYLSGHISHKGIPGVEFSTGSLGHGLSVSCGMALAAKLNKQDYSIFTLLSDGELDEGSNWEAIMFAAHHKLDNLVAIIDYNKLQSILSVKKTMNLEPLKDKWTSFGWKVHEIDGHNHRELRKKLLEAKNSSSKKPICIIAHTVKGKGVSFMENNNLWHYRSPQGLEFEKAMKELEN